MIYDDVSEMLIADAGEIAHHSANRDGLCLHCGDVVISEFFDTVEIGRTCPTCEYREVVPFPVALSMGRLISED